MPLYPPASRVGAWLATHACLAELARLGHQVDVVPFLMSGDTWAYVLDGVNVHPRARFDEIATGCDLVLSHLGDDGMASRWAKANDVPSVRMVHGIPQPHHHLDDDLAVFNSRSLADAVGWKRRKAIVHPPVDLEQFRTTPGDCVTLVNLSSAKGGAVFWQLAKSMPGVRFLGVRGGYGHQISNKAKNTVVIPGTMDMATDVYARTRVLLMPSSHESWGMVGLEAMISGIPVIAHPTPGLQESLGDAGIFVDRGDLDGWRTEIRRLMSPSAWQEASSRARAHAEQFDHQEQLRRFTKAVLALVKTKAPA